MSGTHTSHRPRIAGQLSSTGAIASEDRFFKDEVDGREFYIPFRQFAHAFLWSGEILSEADYANATAYRQSPEFRDPCASYHRLVSSTETGEVYLSLVQLMNHIVDSERQRPDISDAVPLWFTSSTSTHPIRSFALRKPDMCGLQTPAEPVVWPSVSVACEYKCQPPVNDTLDSITLVDAVAPPLVPQPPPERPRLPSLSHLSNTSNPSGRFIPSCSHLTPPRSHSSHSFPCHSHSSHSSRSGYSAPPRSSNSMRTSPALTVEQDIQLSHYLLEMRSQQANRDAVLGILFMGSYASFWYADSDSTIKSRFIPVDSDDFVSAIMCLARANPARLGYSPHFRTSDGSVLTSQPIEGARFILDETATVDTAYTLSDIISHARALHGRCSRALGATRAGRQENYVLKLSHQVVSRANEADLIKRAQKREVAGLVRLYDSFTLKKLSEGPRSRLPPDLIPGMPNHLLVEDRELRVLVLARCMPLYSVSDPHSFLKACISLLHTICDLYEIGDIMHQDISVNNLMVEMDNPGVGVLIDLDRAVDHHIDGNNNASSLHRTGTLPFMALDLLHDDDKYPHHLRHDLESFLYVLFWIAGRYESGSEVNLETFNEWCEGSWDKISTFKHGFITFSPSYKQFKPTHGFSFFSDGILSFRKLLGNAHTSVTYEHQSKIAGFASTQGGNDYPQGRSPSKRQRLHLVPSIPYPPELKGVNRRDLDLILNNALLNLGQPPPGSSTGA